MNEGNDVLFQPPMTKGRLFILDAVLLVLVLLGRPAAKLLLAIPVDCYIQRFGYLCPACGGTRSVLMLFRGDLGEAFRMNAYFCLTGMFSLMLLVLLHISVLSRRPDTIKLCRWIFQPYVPVVWAIGFVIFGILRNVM